MWKEVVVIPALLCFGFAIWPQENKQASQEKPAVEIKVPLEEANRKNPVVSSPNSIAEGKRLYGFECALCHGKEGDGKGDLAEGMKVKLRDWRDPAALKDFTDGEIFYIINKGKGEMSAEEGRIKPEQIWQMVNYLRSLAKNQPPKP
jgi:mono/diheme cytochrome c family protein